MSDSPDGLLVVLDTGATLSAPPKAAFTAIGTDFPGAELSPDGSAYSIPSDWTDAIVEKYAGSVEFTLGNKTISVACSDCVWNAEFECLLAVETAAPGEYMILDDNFLRAA